MREELLNLFNKAVQAVSPSNLLPNWIQSEPNGIRIDELYFSSRSYPKLLILAAGKAASAMAQEAVNILSARLLTGVVATKHEHGRAIPALETIEAGHPVPDANSLIAGAKMLAACEMADAETLILFLMSGGASSLIIDLPEGASLEELQDAYRILVTSGADINIINQLRKMMSPRIKGGKLAQVAMPATIVTLIISDVPGDVVADIGSGPMIPQKMDRSVIESALEDYPVLRSMPESCLAALLNFPEPGKIQSDKIHYRIIGSNKVALESIARSIPEGTRVIIREKALSGEASEMAEILISEMESIDSDEGFYYLAGGETTVTIRGDGKGGRNQELALAAAIVLQRSPLRNRISLLAAGTDGTDGPTDATGAFVDAELLGKVDKKNLDPAYYLTNNDAYTFFEQVGGLFKTGPTGTNVMDLFIAWVAPH